MSSSTDPKIGQMYLAQKALCHRTMASTDSGHVTVIHVPRAVRNTDFWNTFALRILSLVNLRVL